VLAEMPVPRNCFQFKNLRIETLGIDWKLPARHSQSSLLVVYIDIEINIFYPAKDVNRLRQAGKLKIGNFVTE
jgi:hypothetical protein